MASRWVKSPLTAGCGPYVDWNLGPGKPYYRLPRSTAELWSPVILQVEGISPADMLAKVNKRARHLGLPTPVLRCCEVRRPDPPTSAAALYGVYLARDEFFEVLAHKTSHDLRSELPRVVLGQQVVKGALGNKPELKEPKIGNAQPASDTVVVAVIDDSIAFAHERFRTSAGKSRVEYAWVQDAAAVKGKGRVDYGREYRKKEIDALLAQATYAGAIDEDQFYRLAGVSDFSRPGQGTAAQHASHGTHVMDLACGEDPRSVPDDAVKQPIVCVGLPSLASEDTSGASLEPYVYHAIEYILDRADRIAGSRGCGRLPVVINFSYGFIAGPHDGSSVIEAAIDAIVQERAALGQQVRVVLPAGNSNLTRCHAEVSFGKGKKAKELRWQMQPNDETSSFMEIWLPPRKGDGKDSRLSLTVTPPGGPESPPLDETSGAGVAYKLAGDIVCKLSYREEPGPVGRGRFFIAALPTSSLKPETRLAPSGDWIVKLKNHALGKEEVVRVWIQRDDSRYGFYRRGRQSFFDERCYHRYTEQGWIIADDGEQPPCTVKRAGLLNAIATGAGTIVVGGFRRQETSLADYSSCSTETQSGDPAISYRNLDAVAVSDDTRVFEGVLGAGSRSGSVIAMNGTSVAAPQVARWVAKELAHGNQGDAAALKAKAQEDNNKLPPLSEESKHRAGAGRLILSPVFPLARYWD